MQIMLLRTNAIDGTADQVVHGRHNRLHTAM